MKVGGGNGCGGRADTDVRVRVWGGLGERVGVDEGVGIDGRLGKDEELAGIVEGWEEREDPGGKACEVIVGDDTGVREDLSMFEERAQAGGVVGRVQVPCESARLVKRGAS